MANEESSFQEIQVLKKYHAGMRNLNDLQNSIFQPRHREEHLFVASPQKLGHALLDRGCAKSWVQVSNDVGCFQQ